MRGRHVTLLVVPDDERAVRRFRLSIRRLEAVALAAGIVVVLALAAIVTYGRVSARAARAVRLEQENTRLAAENAKVERLAANLERTERTYRQIRTLAGLPIVGPEAERAAGVLLAGNDLAGEPAPEPRSTSKGEPAGWPLALKGFVTAGYGGAGGHSGVDIAVPTDTPVLATAAGVVRQTGYDDVLGSFVVLSHGGGFETMYAHNGHLLVERGESMERGASIATSGNSGRSTAPHLHYEVRRGGLPIDPEPYLP